MKIILPILVFSAFLMGSTEAVFGAQSIEARTFDCKLSEVNYLTAELFLYNNSQYELLFSEVYTSDHIGFYGVSYGSYIINDHRIRMTDARYGYNMEFIDSSQYVFAIKGLKWLFNKKFEKWRGHFRGIPFFQEEALKPLEETIRDFLKEQKAPHPLIIAFYEYGATKISPGWILDIRSNHKYRLTFRNILISDGVWSRNPDENVLVLLDATLNHSFHALIGENYIVVNLLSGYYEQLTLFRSRTKEVFFVRDKTDPRYSPKPFDWSTVVSLSIWAIHK